MDVCHDIVSSLLLFLSSDLKLLCIKMLRPHESTLSVSLTACTYKILFHLLDCLIGDRETKLLFGDGEVEPELSPRMEAMLQTAFGMDRQ